MSRWGIPHTAGGQIPTPYEASGLQAPIRIGTGRAFPEPESQRRESSRSPSMSDLLPLAQLLDLSGQAAI